MDLGIEDFSLEEDFEIIKGAFSHMAGRDYAASRGEFLNSKVLAKYLGFDLLMLQNIFSSMKEENLIGIKHQKVSSKACKI